MHTLADFETLSLALLGIGVLVALLQLRAGHEWRRRKAAQDVVGEYLGLAPRVKELNTRIKFLDRKEAFDTKELQDLLTEDDDLRITLHRYLNFFEWIAVGVKNNVYDEKIIRSTVGWRLSNVRLVFRNYIEEQQERLYGGLFSESLELAKDWEYGLRGGPKRSATG